MLVHRSAEQHEEELSKLPVWLFSSGPLGGNDPQPYEEPDKFTAALGNLKARDHAVFVGKLDPAQLGLGEWLMVKMVRAPMGDFRDWEQIRSWAQRIATDLPSMLVTSER